MSRTHRKHLKPRKLSQVRPSLSARAALRPDPRTDRKAVKAALRKERS